MSELSRSLQPRHVTMISIGGIIGAGLFVGSSASIAATGPAIVLSYLITGTLVLLVMRMLGEMAVALPAVRSFTEFARVGLGPWAGFVAGWLYWYFWIIVVPVEAIAGARILHDWLGLPAWLLGIVLMAIRYLEFGRLNVNWDHDAYGSATWMLMILHATHVLTDLADTVVLGACIFTRKITASQFSDVNDNSFYWSFVVLTWLPIYALVYWGPRLL